MPAYYADTVGNFRAASVDSLELTLLRAYESDRYKTLFTPQITSWRDAIETLKGAFDLLAAHDQSPNNWGVAFEFVIPRKMARIDVVLLIGSAVVVIEFKGESIDSAAADQAEDYCLDLLHFHGASRNRVIYPIVVGRTAAPPRLRRSRTFSELRPTTYLDIAGLAEWLKTTVNSHHDEPQIPIHEWDRASYEPVPTIVEAAIGMFAEMQVEDIAKAGCDPINLTATVDAVRRIAAESADQGKKTICFITGVPGAGKTLAGLKLVHDQKLRDATGSDCVFLTGNLPLVDVLREALTRDASRRSGIGQKITGRDPKTTINTVIGYKKEHTRNESPPHERLVVFDEAQRAWDAKRTAKYLSADARSYEGYSEPALLLSILNRHSWCVFIALVGGGQEIHTGEAGLAEWGRSLFERFRDWSIVVPPQALSGDYGAGAKLFDLGVVDKLRVQVEPDLHLDNPTRQFRGKTISRWAESLLQGDAAHCRSILKDNPDYPIYVTRKLADAKCWLTSIALGTERYGLIASSGARRLRAEGLELPAARARGVEYWFLNGKGDVRSSFQLEVAATEFQIQGLEIDWAGVCWGGDFTRSNTKWDPRSFKGTTWYRIHDQSTRDYVPNTYRVLLTRARQGMVLFVPPGDDEDATRQRAPLDETAQFLLDCGAAPL